MVDAPARGPLAGFGLAAAPARPDPETGLRLVEAPFARLLELRGPPTDAFREAVAGATGLELPGASPETRTRDSAAAFWMGPDRWWLLWRQDADGTEEIPDSETLRRTLDASVCAVFEITDAWACIRVSGKAVRDVLAKGCTIDLHPRAMVPGTVVQTLLAGMRIVLNHNGESAYDIYGPRSSAEHLWNWLEDAGREFGVSAVQSPIPDG